MRIGKDAAENWKIFDEADEEDVWVHLKSFPSPHVILKEENISEKNILEASHLCKDSSKFKNLKNIKIVNCKVKYLQKGDVVGTIIMLRPRKCNYVKI